MGEKAKRFSVVVPVYNVEAYLEECLESVLAQDDGLYEILLVDDGSTDRSGAICDQYAKKYVSVSVIHQQNVGLSEARNTGMKRATGEYLVFLDSDDKLYSDSLRQLEQAIFAQKEPDFIVSRRCTWEGDKLTPCHYVFDAALRSQKHPADIYQSLQNMPDCWLGAWIFTVKRSYAERWQLYFYPGILHEDEEWGPRLFFHAERIGFNDFPLYCNRIGREGSITATPNIKREFDRLKILDLLQNEFQQGPYDEKSRQSVAYRRQQIYFGVLCQAYLYHANARYDALIQEMKRHRNTLRDSKRGIYRMAYISLAFLGMKKTCHSLYCMDQWKRR